MTKEFDERNAAKSRNVCAAMAERADTGKRKLTERERQILDMWPRFEEGEPVMVGDRFIDHRVNERTVRSVIVNDDGVELRTFDGTFDWHETGERVKRPAPEDSWEQLESDAALSPGDYVDKRGRRTDLYAYQDIPMDIVRRAKALAGVEVGR